jgi:hypothetical protein
MAKEGSEPAGVAEEGRRLSVNTGTPILGDEERVLRDLPHRHR